MPKQDLKKQYLYKNKRYFNKFIKKMDTSYIKLHYSHMGAQNPRLSLKKEYSDIYEIVEE